MGARTIGILIAAALAGAASAEAQTAPPVAAQRVQVVETARISEAYPGVVAAARRAQLGFETGGRLAEVTVDVGDRVEEGAALAALDLRTLDAQITAAEASVAEADAAADLARATAAREAALLADGHVSQQRVDEADANTEVAEARVSAAAAQLDQLRVRRTLAVLEAPFSGVITSRHMDEGTIASPGAPVLSLVEADRLEVQAGLPAAQARTLEPGASYDVALARGTVRARVRAVTNVVDPATRTVAAVFDLHPDADATAGEVARVMLNGRVSGPGAWVPLAALSEGRKGLWTVYALAPLEGEAGYRVERRVADVLHTEAEVAFVRGSLQDGELIVAAGVDRIVPDQIVRSVETAPALRGPDASG